MQPRIQLLIEVDEHGNINVTGPIADKALCYGLLESAKDAIRAHAEAQRRIVPAVSSLVPMGRG